MTISDKAWSGFIAALRRVNDAAADAVAKYIAGHGTETQEERQELVAYAYAVATKYGEGAAELACEMYDAVAAASKVKLPPAEPAPTATYGETAKAVYGTLKTESPEVVSGAVGRLVKMAGVDTTMQNAIRDGAEWAWVPQGETCAFCLTLASQGWQKASKKVLKGGHAEHIHANCDCTFAIRFDKESGVAGYDPERYRKMYEAAEGGTPQEKINAMRREITEEQREKPSAQKQSTREDSADTKLGKMASYDVTSEYLNASNPNTGVFLVENEDQRDSHAEEIKVAEIIHRQLGGNFVVRKEIPGKENADYLWMGRLWELKTPKSENNLNKLVQKGLSQIFDNPGGIIVDRTKLDLDIARVEQIVSGRMKTSMKQPTDVMILHGDKIEKIIRYKK